MDPRTSSWAPPAQLNGLRNTAFAVGGVAMAISVAGYFMGAAQFMHSFTTAFVYVLALPVGGLGLLMLNHVTKGAWGVVTRRILEALARSIPVMAIFFLPLLADTFSGFSVFRWADPEVVANDPLLATKTLFLNAPFFAVRAAIYFVIWTALAFTLSTISNQQDHDSCLSLAKRMQGTSAGGLVIYMLVTTFAAFDWIMTLDPHWFSSIYGVYYALSAALAALCLTVLVAVWLSKREPMNEVYRRGHYGDWGKLMLAFTMLWAYFSVSQLIIMWSGNLPEEVPWYIVRTSGMYKYFAQAVIVLHFFVPFALLLSADLKRNPARLSMVAAYILVMRFVDLYWHVAPSFNVADPGAARMHWLDLTLPIGMGGLWLGVFFIQLAARPLIPRNEPFLQEALSHHG